MKEREREREESKDSCKHYGEQLSGSDRHHWTSKGNWIGLGDGEQLELAIGSIREREKRAPLFDIVNGRSPREIIGEGEGDTLNWGGGDQAIDPLVFFSLSFLSFLSSPSLSRQDCHRVELGS